MRFHRRDAEDAEKHIANKMSRQYLWDVLSGAKRILRATGYGFTAETQRTQRNTLPIK